MSVLIEGMEMPESCFMCELMQRTDDGMYMKCPLVKFKCSDEDYYGYFAEHRQAECPLVPVPPHGRLGDLDRLEQMFVDIDNAPYSGFDGTEPFYSAEDAAQIIRLAHTIIPASEEG